MKTKGSSRQGGSRAKRFMKMSPWLALAVFPCLLLGCGGGGADGPQQVVVYAALDAEFSQAILDDFTDQTGIRVLPKFDIESTKTIGLRSTIEEERARPRCDLFWNNEILNTLILQQQGLLRPYKSPAAAAYPASAKSPRGMWHGFAARARILIVNTNRMAPNRRPKSIRDLIDVQWRDQAGIAKPLFGTTATHATCLFAAWGEEEAKDFFLDVKRNARIMGSNRDVARAVAAGTLAFGLTDTDDAVIELEKGMPVTIIYPDQREGELGTLFIPNTLALIKDSPHPAAADKLVDYLLSAEVERKLADGPSAQIPLRPGVAASARLELPPDLRKMQVDWQAAAAKWETAREFLADEFTAAN